ncbi:two-component regulator propeller domain-containing protein [Lysobacter firmicutimachus]|uniref:Two-component regulator propeller domain-containing protein n=1 Tax=Lysobacter firmicutimachus TaxID=1792846 RepID=A0AAU8MZ88_9GAMM
MPARILTAVALIAWLVCMPRGVSARPRFDAPQYHHSAWSLRDGAPADIWAIAQGRDGYLWLGTGTGLYRFDGVQFEPYRPSGPEFASNNITALTVAGDGSVWMGFLIGGVSVVRDGRVHHYGPAEGAPTQLIMDLAADRDGVVWAAAASGLARYERGSWRSIGAEWGYPGPRADALWLDARGTLWVTTGTRLVYLPRGARRFLDSGEPAGLYASLAQDLQGRIWISDGEHGTRAVAATPALSARLRRTPTAYARLARMRVDRHGALWGTDRSGGGVVRTSALPRFGTGYSLRANDLDAAIGKRNGLTSDRAVPVFEDREGNVWVGTNLGLHRFRFNRINALPDERLNQQNTYAIGIDGASGRPLVSAGEQLFRIDADDLVPLARSGRGELFDAIARGDGGRAWIATRASLWRRDNGAMTALPAPIPGAGPRLLAPAPHSQLWAIWEPGGLQHFDGGHWRAAGAGVLRWRDATVLAGASDGAVWIGYPRSELARWDGVAQRRYGSADGLRIGALTAIAELSPAPGSAAGEPDMLVAGETGLALIREGRVRSLAADRPQRLTGITGIVAAADAALWLNGMRGLVRIERDELERALAKPGHALRTQLFDDDDGLPGLAQQAVVTPSALATADGRLWFATNQGVATVDPAQVRANSVAPPVTIRGLAANGRRYPPGPRLKLPEQARDLQIDYASLSLSMPRRAQFRYRLVGLDGRWRDAGNRRQAFYTNLPPGDYRFEVIAANESGLWSRRAATQAFSIAPRFTETWWFAMLCAMATAAALFGAYLLRLRQISARLHARLEERHQERERIARELHDTLLQSTQGLILRLQGVANKVPHGDPTRAAIESALDRADEVIAEARDRVRDLRAGGAGLPQGLADAFAYVGAELAEQHPAEFKVVVEGRLPELDPLLRDELFRIGREALANAFRHARARHIEVELACDRKRLRLRVRDDGRGIDETVQRAGGRPGHWGLSGMRERALGVGAQFRLWSRSGGGTEIEVTLPLAACAGRRNTHWRRWLRRIRTAIRRNPTDAP